LNQLYFAQIREDSLVERHLTDTNQPKTIVTIGSGGCTALSLLQDEVHRVYAIDQNEAQAALIECKKAAIQALSREEFLSFIGEAEATDRLETYRRVAPLLPAYAREYWDRHPGDIAMGINQCGATERFYRFIGQNIRLNVYGDEVWDALFACRSVDEQIAFSEKYLTTEAWRTAVRLLLSKTTHLQFFPAFMFAHARENDFGAFFEAMFLRELRSKPVTNNYFLSQLLFATYLYNQPEGLPRYLSESGYAVAKRNLHKLTVVPLSLQQALPGLEGVDAFYLSNVFDWADQPAREQICTAILRAKSDSAVVMYRNMLAANPLPDFFRDRLRVDEELSRQMTALERSMMYQQITVGELA
jgi:S-adenosylmethionine-diacylglycerol 3-amino-3-carboxypropyl transferase